MHQDSWIKNTALFVLPGGADLPYVHELFGAGTDNLKRFVRQGRKLIAICAGQYFCADYIDFKSANLNVSGERFLKFFPGKIVGPAFPTLPRFVNVCTADAKFSIRYNGGGRFINPEKYDCVNVVATYDDGDAAIVECCIGESGGQAIISGVHFEKPDANGELKLAKSLLARLSIRTKLEIPCPKLKLRLS